MDLLIVSNYWHFEWEKSSSRYLSIANMCADAGMDVEVVTSSFYHTTKQQRNVSQEELNNCKYKVTLISEPGYTRNVDPKRILSHKKFAKNVFQYLKSRKKPDVIYLFVPPLDLAEAVVSFANKNYIRIIIDILDLWPEAYNMILPFSKVSHFLLEPMRRKANRVYAGADDIVAVSETYVNRVMNVNKKCQNPISVYIGIELGLFDSFITDYHKDHRYIDVVYIGMLGKSYDLKCAIEAISILQQTGLTNVRLIVMGDGPLKKEFEQYAKYSQICYEFTGRLPYGDMVNRLVKCDIALNVISKGAAQSIINKHADYLAAGLPIVNNQEIAEFGNLLTRHNCGINCDNKNAVSLANAIKKLALDESLRKNMGNNARALAEDKFNREITYREIIRCMKK